MPQTVPTDEDPSPPPHDLTTTRLPALILAAHEVPAKDFPRHVWQVSVALVKDEQGRPLRETTVVHQGKVLDKRRTAR